MAKRRGRSANFAHALLCPKCGRNTAMNAGADASSHLRWCIWCNVSFFVVWDRRSAKWRQRKLRKGIPECFNVNAAESPVP